MERKESDQCTYVIQLRIEFHIFLYWEPGKKNPQLALLLARYKKLKLTEKTRVQDVSECKNQRGEEGRSEETLVFKVVLWKLLWLSAKCSG